jgi:hypothetical protein
MKRDEKLRALESALWAKRQLDKIKSELESLEPSTQAVDTTRVSVQGGGAGGALEKWLDLKAELLAASSRYLKAYLAVFQAVQGLKSEEEKYALTAKYLSGGDSVTVASLAREMRVSERTAHRILSLAVEHVEISKILW